MNSLAAFSNMSSSSCIPLVDFSPYISGPEGNKSRRKTADEVYEALRTFGVVYLKHHGIATETVEAAHLCAKEYFELPIEAKMKHARRHAETQGYLPLETLRLNQERPADLREAYAFVQSLVNGKSNWPKEAAEFTLSAQKLMEKGACLAMKVLEVIAEGLGLQTGVKTFEESHHINDQEMNKVTGLLAAHYPAVQQDVKPGQIRCGEHTDWGSITLIFQDSVGGLQMQNQQGEWIPVMPVPDTVVVIIGDMMQRWTADKLQATKHRVIIPEGDLTRKQARYSLIYFMNPDADYIVKCLDGSDRYDPISYGPYMKAKLDATY